MKKATRESASRSIGVDLAKRTSQVCVFADGQVEREFKVCNTAEAWRESLKGVERGRVIMEVGGSSPWISRLLVELGFDVWVVRASTIKQLFKQRRKNDRDDARALAIAGAQCPDLLQRVLHRSERTQRDHFKIVQRDALVRTRTSLIACLRGSLSSFGIDVPICSSDAINRRVLEHVSEDLRGEFTPILIALATISAQVKQLDDEIAELADERYPETKALRQITGVGALTALAFVLRVEDPKRFARNRAVGAYFGLAQGQQQSGDSDPQMPITKTGDRLVRRLLVQAAHYVLGPFGPDSDLKRFGKSIADRGGPRAKRRAVVAVARRLAVLMLSLWKSGEVYEPLRIASSKAAAAIA